MTRFGYRAFLLLVAVLAACGPPGASDRSTDIAGSPPPASRTLVMIIRVEPQTIASKPLLDAAGTTTTVQKRIFNAGLVFRDNRDLPRPYLAESLPELQTDAWRLFPDGRMETTYRLKPGLTWHDGVPLSAEDFVFAWRVYGRPEFGLARTSPLNRMEEIASAGDQTVAVRWRQPFPNAGVLLAADFQPLPRHLLQDIFEQAASDFPNHPFWSREYVGLGPFRLERWEPGSFVEAAAFDGHVLGRPRIDRLRLIFVPDQNTVLGNLLSEAAHISVDFSIRLEQTRILKQEWGPRNGGSVLFDPSTWRFTQIQRRPEYLTTPAVLDLRVRQALAHGIDKQALNDGLFAGEGIMSDTMIPLTVDYYPSLQPAISTYPYDVRRAERLMSEAGFGKGPDGFYARPGDGRFAPELMVQTSAQSERELSILASVWRQIGFDVQERVLPAALVSDGEARSTFRTLANTGGGSGDAALVNNFSSARIPGPNNRWSGSNRGAWSNAEFDRLAEAFDTTLVRSERVQQIIAMAKLVSDDLAAISLFFDLQLIAHAAALRGPESYVTDVSWNIHEWELR